MKPEFSRQIFEKENTNMKCMKVHPVRAWLFHVDGRTDKQDEADSRFPQFCERAYRTLSYIRADTVL
jgi:hypothetical protein